FFYDSNLCIAVSQTADPTGKWNVYQIAVTPSPDQGGIFGTDLLDFPHIAVGSDAIYIAGNQFTDIATTYSGARVYAINKSQMYGGASAAAGASHDVSDVMQDTLQPARGIGVAKTMYFVSTDNNCTCHNANLWKWSDPFGADSFTYQGAVPFSVTYE